MKRLLLGFGLLSLMGCKETVDSTDVRTSGVYAELEAVSDGSGTRVSAKLKVGGSNSNTFMDLDGNDQLSAKVEDEEKDLHGENQVYRASFEEDSGGTPVEISFLRGSDDEDAPSSTVTLPEPFTLDGVDKDDNISRQEDVVITWDPSGTDDDMEWKLDGDCVDLEFDNSMNDTGTLTLAAGRIEPAFEDDEAKSCTVTFTLDRVRSGNLDDAFGEGGYILGIQRRSVSFVSSP